MTVIAADLAEAIEIAKSGGHSMLLCPAHEDRQPSLHVASGTTQPVVLRCHAGCEVDDILAAAGVPLTAILAEEDPFRTVITPRDEWTPAGPASHIYRYLDEHRNEVFQVLRIPLPGRTAKTFRQRHRGPDGRWVWNMDGVPRVLYRLPEVIEAKAAGETIYLVEGEKDAETLVRLGKVATTSPMGAGKWREEYSQALAGATVVIIADADATGREHARKVRESLVEHGCLVSVMEPRPGAKDITEHVEGGGALDELVETVPGVEEPKASYGVDVLDVIVRRAGDIVFLMPGVMAKGDRLLLTGIEGHGKSTLIRQMAVQAAAGLHWWTGSPTFDGRDVEPQRVLFIDVENHPDQVLTSWQDLVGLAAYHGRPLERNMLTILEDWDTEVDLTTSEGHDWLIERVHAYRPGLIFMGPLYNMSGRDLKDDETVRRIKSVVNEARSAYGAAFVMEHHAPHKGPADKERSVRPYGSSTFLKWPDYGYGMRPTAHEGVYEFQRTRFPRVRSRYFPEALRWGVPNSAEWPWVECILPEEEA